MIRSVKTIVVGDFAGARQRQIAGVLSAAQTAELSFAVPGTVSEVLVEEGMSVSSGQVLARLDPRVYELALSSARAQLASARAELEERRLNFERQESLWERRLIARAALDQATAELETARARVEAVEADVNRARRDIDRTALAAPYAGRIASRSVEPFQEVPAGATLFTLEGATGVLADVLVPESMIRDVSYGDAVVVRFPSLPDVEVPGTVAEIGSRIDAGNAFPVRVRLERTEAAEAELRPGLSARVSFELERDGGRPIALIPLSAIALGDRSGPAGAEAAGQAEDAPGSASLRRAPVFVYDEAAGSVRRREVLAGDLNGNLVEVYEGLEPGTRVVVAGVSFLRDGMPARLWLPDL
ncbi:MAG: efflux RND transporter periplasmic adaptor subunit [Pseudomonadales bacterium]|nr:efflux RND transporter periplasmic adaptor subunit [Pseudomonadales bacterium]